MLAKQHSLFPLVHRDHFYQFGEICNLHIMPKQKCAFVTYTTREAAEKAAHGSFNKLINCQWYERCDSACGRWKSLTSFPDFHCLILILMVHVYC